MSQLDSIKALLDQAESDILFRVRDHIDDQLKQRGSGLSGDGPMTPDADPDRVEQENLAHQGQQTKDEATRLEDAQISSDVDTEHSLSDGSIPDNQVRPETVPENPEDKLMKSEA